MDSIASAPGLFDVPDGVTYLNCAYLPPLPRPVREAGKRAIDGHAPWATTARDFFEPGEPLRARVGALFGGDADGVAFVPSVSYGIGVAARNLPVGPGRTVVVVDEEFPSDIYPFRARLTAEGGEFVVVPRPRDDTWTAAIVAAIDERTAVVVAPQVHWTDGRSVDLVEVGRAARAVGAALVIDVSQSLGAAPIDVTAIKPDFLVSVGYKWEMGPYSFGYLWAAEHRRQGAPIEHTWIGRKGSDDFNRLIDYTDEVREGGRRYDVGEWSNFTLLPMASAAVDLLTAWGPQRVGAALAPLTTRVEEGARRLGFEPVAAAHRLPHLIGFRFPMGEPPGLREALASAGVYVSLRANAVRVSPHLYNTVADVDRLLDVLESASK